MEVCFGVLGDSIQSDLVVDRRSTKTKRMEDEGRDRDPGGGPGLSISLQGYWTDGIQGSRHRTLISIPSETQGGKLTRLLDLQQHYCGLALGCGPEGEAFARPHLTSILATALTSSTSRLCLSQLAGIYLIAPKCKRKTTLECLPVATPGASALSSLDQQMVAIRGGLEGEARHWLRLIKVVQKRSS